MPSLSDHQSNKITKMLLLGDSGSGKTGALASLAKAGYNLYIADIDEGLDVLANLLRDSKTPYGSDALGRVKYETLTDQMKQLAGRMVPGRATVWQRLVKLLENWPEKGPITSFTDKDVFVLDSLTFASQAAMNFILSMNARLGQKPHQSDWFEAQILVEGLLQALYDTSVKCNVVVISHITYIGEENGPVHGYPSSLGKSLPPKVGRYFNSALMCKTIGTGPGAKRKIFTNSVGVVELKNTAPLRVANDYPIESGLADYFAAVRSSDAASPSEPKK